MPKGLKSEVKQMRMVLRERWNGPIRDLRLPLAAWRSLQAEGITTIGQLRAVADQLERFDGIGPKTAEVIRDELARAAAPKGSLRPRDRTEAAPSRRALMNSGAGKRYHD